jgi:hypothetical protein
MIRICEYSVLAYHGTLAIVLTGGISAIGGDYIIGMIVCGLKSAAHQKEMGGPAAVDLNSSIDY